MLGRGEGLVQIGQPAAQLLHQLGDGRVAPDRLQRLGARGRGVRHGLQPLPQQVAQGDAPIQLAQEPVRQTGLPVVHAHFAPNVAQSHGGQQPPAPERFLERRLGQRGFSGSVMIVMPGLWNSTGPRAID